MRPVFRAERGALAPEALQEVARVLRAGGLALIPTETVYGIGVAVSAFPGSAPASEDDVLVNGAPIPRDPRGYRRIFELKERDFAQTVPWLVAGPEDLERYGSVVDPSTRALADAFWPGALTLIVPAAPAVPAFMRAADGTVALRASASPVVAELIRACGGPLAVTSANTHGAPAPSSFDQVEPRILAGVDVAVDAGETSCRDASTIISCVSGAPRVIRHGALPASAIERVLARASASSAASGQEG